MHESSIMNSTSTIKIFAFPRFTKEETHSYLNLSENSEVSFFKDFVDTFEKVSKKNNLHLFFEMESLHMCILCKFN